MENIDMVEKTDYQALLDFCIKCAEDKLAENIVTLNIGKVSSVADYMMVATASSEPQLRALSSFIERQVRDEFKLRTLNQPDDSSSGWVLLDFGNLIIHLMTPESRERYNLEGLWGENPSHATAEKLARR
ncbi:MAG: ribosome silencing factor [Lentisphaerae bacterium]|nr:ribosome silencing factor [Lentisphaerota bacterium]